MKLIVTGGAGFIGSAVVLNALAQDGVSVVNVDKMTYASNGAFLKDMESAQNYCFEHVDICDGTALGAVFERHAPDAIMHLAAESHVDRSIDGPAAFVETNIVGTSVLLDVACRYWRSLPETRREAFRFLHISTDEVFGDLGPEEPGFTEETRYAPSSPYSASKASSDHLVRAWNRTYGFPALVTNCSNNYGPRHFPEKLIPLIIANALSGKPLPVYGNGSNVRDWLYVEDHASALFKVLTHGRVGETYMIGGRNECRNIDLVRMICEELELQAPQKPEGVARYADLITFVIDRPGHDRRYAVDSTKIQQELGWTPDETLRSGLRKTVAWYIGNRKWWQDILGGAYDLKRLGLETAQKLVAGEK